MRSTLHPHCDGRGQDERSGKRHARARARRGQALEHRRGGRNYAAREDRLAVANRPRGAVRFGTLDEYQTPYLPLRTGGKFPTATLATADSFASGQDDMALLDSLGADVRDMEGAAIAHIAYAAGVPCTMFKSISDNAREESVREYRENMLIALGALSDNMRKILEEANG